MFPTSWKLANVVPVFKKGSKQYVSNYRPIFILPNFSKIFEKAILNGLHNCILVNNILSQHQYGFRSKFSTYMALLDLNDKITESVDKKK